MSEKSKAAAVLSYLLVGIIWFFADKELQKDSFAKFHVKQGMVFIATVIILQFALRMLFFIGWILMPLVGLLEFVLWIFGIIYALQGKERPLPIIGGFARLLKF